MRFVIVTGLSGSGKTTALKMLEDNGYFCVDNLPPELIGKFAELASNPAQEYSRVALGLDVRSLYRAGDSGKLPERRQTALKIAALLKELDAYPHEILFLDSGDPALVRRYKASRRRHPLALNGRIEDGIALERELLDPLRQRADYVIDTSELLTRALREELDRIFAAGSASTTLFLSILSFGFKYGIPSDADLVFDVRFLPNPYYVDELRSHTGNEQDVQDYVCSGGDADIFLEKTADLLDFLIPRYLKEGKRQLTIAVGCTGGKHRSVTVANRLADLLNAQGRYPVALLHRDITR